MSSRLVFLATYSISGAGSSRCSSARVPSTMIWPSWRMGDLVGQLLSLLEVLSRQQHCGSVGGKLSDGLPDLEPSLRVESCRGLVEEDHGRIADEAIAMSRRRRIPPEYPAVLTVAGIAEAEASQEPIGDLVGLGHVAQSCDEDEVLSPGKYLVNCGELTGEADRVSHLRRLLSDVVTHDLAAPLSARRERATGCGMSVVLPAPLLPSSAWMVPG